MDEASGFSIGELSRRTGVPVATLRTWETRYGQPRSHRLPSGHRRYDQAAVRAVQRMLSHREAGVSLDVAAARLDESEARARSVFAVLRDQHPELVAQTMAKPTLLALTRAIEDEYLAGARPGVLFGAFQTAAQFEGSGARWRAIARSSEFAVALADFQQPTVEEFLVLAPLADGTPLTREWLLVCDGPFPAVVAGWEPPGQEAPRDPDRVFETLWSLDPRAVRTAALICLAQATPYLPDGGASLQARLSGSPPPASDDLARATRLFQRLVAYVAPPPP